MNKSDYPIWEGDFTQPQKNVKVVGEDIVKIPESTAKIDLKTIKSRLTKVRTQMMLDKPFLGNLVLRLPLKAADSWCKTSATEQARFNVIFRNINH